MRARCFVAMAMTAASASIPIAGTVASEFKIFGIREDGTSAYVRLGGPPMPTYGAALHAEVFREIRRNRLPFRVESPITVVVRFVVDRQGRLIQYSMLQGSGSKLIDDYTAFIVRQAAARFPPPPSDQRDDVAAFAIPIEFN